MSELLGIVGAMRSLAGLRRQEAQRSLPAVRRYAETLASAVGDALRLARASPAPDWTAPARRAVVLYLAEHGFVGGLNEPLITAARETVAAGDHLLVLGSHGAAQATERDLRPAWVASAPTRETGVVQAANLVARELYRRIASGDIDCVEILYARAGMARAPLIERRRLLPVDLPPLRRPQPAGPPLHNLDATVLVETLTAEYVFALLTEATVESLASENAARFATMESAHDNIGRKLDQLRQAARQARQDDITTELLDVITGAEATNESSAV